MSLWKSTRHNNGEDRRPRQAERNAAGDSAGVVMTIRMDYGQ
jgi:hypothetical protein